MKNTGILLLAAVLLLPGCSKEPGTTSPKEPSHPANELPVVFHVLYENAEDRRQNPAPEIFAGRIRQMNLFFGGSLYPQAGSVSVPVSFKAAETDPSGKKLDEPGIHRVCYRGAASIDAYAFMKSKHPEGSPESDIFWDPNRYINIWIATFMQTDDPETSQQKLMGISYYPYAPASHTLAGLPRDKNDAYRNKLPDYMHGIALNNTWFYDDAEKSTVHEMGHYLGLRHAFAETDEAYADANDYTDDFCRDTPKYDRKTYEAWLDDAEDGNEEAYMRTSFSGRRFRSVNIMDYYVGDRTTITPEQRERICFVLDCSPLIPRPAPEGGKTGARQTVGRHEGVPTAVLTD